MIEIDGAIGEGGGQILRTALTLSMITGQGFALHNIRAGRAKPGLLRQHLVAVQAAALVCGAQVSGAALGSGTLVFSPGPIKAGHYQFAIGSAGSCTLVLQTLLLALAHADGPSTVRVSGGTHNPMAPPAHFVQRAYCRVLAAMGVQVELEIERAGFYPAGGGVVVAAIAPCAGVQPLELIERGQRVAAYAEAFVAGIPASVGERELACIGAGMGWDAAQLHLRCLPGEQGPGNAVLITLEHEHVTEVFTGFGEKSVRAESVARQVINEARRYIASQAAVGEHLADQLMLPMALAGRGAFTADTVSPHAQTNAGIIGRFLLVAFTFEEHGSMHLCRVQAA